MVRQAKDGFAACLNRDAHRSDRLPAMAVLNTFLGWDDIQGCSLHPRLCPIPLPFVGRGQLLRLIGDTTMALGVLCQHDYPRRRGSQQPDAPSGPAQLRSH